MANLKGILIIYSLAIAEFTEFFCQRRKRCPLTQEGFSQHLAHYESFVSRLRAVQAKYWKFYFRFVFCSKLPFFWCMARYTYGDSSRSRWKERDRERESGKQRIFDSFPFSFSIQLCCVKRVDRQSSISFSSFVRQFGSNSGGRSLAFFGRSCFSFFDRWLSEPLFAPRNSVK